MELVELLGQVNLGDVGLAGLVTLFFLLLFTGKVVPGSTVDRIRSDADTRVQEAVAQTTLWHTAYLTEQQVNGEQNAQLKELLEHAKTANHLLREIQPDHGAGAQ